MNITTRKQVTAKLISELNDIQKVRLNSYNASFLLSLQDGEVLIENLITEDFVLIEKDFRAVQQAIRSFDLVYKIKTDAAKELKEVVSGFEASTSKLEELCNGLQKEVRIQKNKLLLLTLDKEHEETNKVMYLNELLDEMDLELTTYGYSKVCLELKKRGFGCNKNHSERSPMMVYVQDIDGAECLIRKLVKQFAK